MRTIKLGLLRGGLEIKEFLRQRESVVFTLAFPVILLFIFGSVFLLRALQGKWKEQALSLESV